MFSIKQLPYAFHAQECIKSINSYSSKAQNRLEEKWLSMKTLISLDCKFAPFYKNKILKIYRYLKSNLPLRKSIKIAFT